MGRNPVLIGRLFLTDTYLYQFYVRLHITPCAERTLREQAGSLGLQKRSPPAWAKLGASSHRNGINHFIHTHSGQGAVRGCLKSPFLCHAECSVAQ
jgi:hypothetical protein